MFHDSFNRYTRYRYLNIFRLPERGGPDHEEIPEEKSSEKMPLFAAPQTKSHMTSTLEPVGNVEFSRGKESHSSGGRYASMSHRIPMPRSARRSGAMGGKEAQLCP